MRLLNGKGKLEILDSPHNVSRIKFPNDVIFF